MSQIINPEELQLFASCLEDYFPVMEALAGSDRQRLIASLALLSVMYADVDTGELITMVEDADHGLALSTAFPLGYLKDGSFVIEQPNAAEAIGRLEEWLPLKLIELLVTNEDVVDDDSLNVDPLIAYGLADNDEDTSGVAMAVQSLADAWYIALFPDGLINKVKVCYSHPAAVRPSKTRYTDVGLDLTLVGLHSQKGTMRLYHTGVHVSPPYGYYTQVVPRSSIVKTGFMLANSVGIIDPAYTGEILIALQKVDSDAAELELPLRLGQLILVKREHFIVEEVENLTTTDRGTGGFGSTGR